MHEINPFPSGTHCTNVSKVHIILVQMVSTTDIIFWQFIVKYQYINLISTYKWTCLYEKIFLRLSNYRHATYKMVHIVQIPA